MSPPPEAVVPPALPGVADLVLACLAFAAFAATACPEVHWLDSGELTASAWALGVAHPPGEAPWALLARLPMSLPFGDVAFRANVASAAFAALCVPAVTVLAHAALGGLRDPRSRAWLSRGAAVAAALGGASWLQAVRAEVYSLQAALTLWGAALLVLPDGVLPRDTRWSLAALACGLAAANHPLLLVASLPALAVLALSEAGIRRGAWGPAAAAGTLGFSSVLYLPVRAAASPADAWGSPDRLPDAVAVLTGRVFAQNFSLGDGVGTWENAGTLASLVRLHGGPALLPLAAAGGVVLAARGPRPLGLGLALLVLGNAGTVLPQNKVFLDNPDLHGYAAVGYAGLCVLAANALGSLSSWMGARRGRSLGRGIALAGALALSAQALAGAAFGSRAGDRMARSFAAGLVSRLPPGAPLVTAGNDATFLLWYGERVEGWRPDLRTVHRVLLGHGFYDRELRRRAGPRPGGLDPGRVRVDLPGALSAISGPAWLEFRERDFAAAPSLVPRGLLMEWRGPGPAEVREEDLEVHRARLAEALPDPGDAALSRDVHARTVAVYVRALLGGYFAARGRPDLAAAEAAAIRQVEPAWRGPWPSPEDGLAGPFGGAP
ncbi:DUF2723 domain-containing protein [Myxococcota bacterium]|nr:DUF2723 domain-containing protein [Myxococcota bacterium]